MMAEHGTNDFITIPSLPSILETLPSILEKWGRLPKMANFDDLEIEYDGEKKSLFPNSYRHVLFAKKTGSNWSNLACVAPYIFYIRL